MATRRVRTLTFAILATVVAVFAAQYGFASVYRFPVPAVHDEFAYLLAGDTFASGRITNPTHPFWEHFDTFHVLQRPSYQAKYPPGQGGFLALGTLLFGHPAFGVWLALSLAAGACVWMLAGVLPLGWALLAPLLFLSNLPVLQNWGQSYWGGGAAMLGGALFFGALIRFFRGSGTSVLWWGGLGLLLLANTRPLEGAVAALCGVVAGVPLLRGKGADPRLLLRRMTPVALTIVAVIVGWGLYYNWCVTGSPTRMPYLEWSAQGSPHEELHSYAGSTSLSLVLKLRRLQIFFLGGILTLGLPFLLLRTRDSVLRYAVLVLVPVAATSLLFTKSWPHYLAPVACLVLLLLAFALRAACRLRWKSQPVGAVIVIALVAGHLAVNGQRCFALLQRAPQSSWHLDRQAIVERLEGQGGQHLILVSYAPDRSLHEEWVYNASDIDRSKVIWARDLGEERNTFLLNAYTEREVWSLTPGSNETRLRPYGQRD